MRAKEIPVQTTAIGINIVVLVREKFLSVEVAKRLQCLLVDT